MRMLKDSEPKLPLDGTVAVVTDANRGIGRAIAVGLAHAGAAVAVSARDASTLDAVVEEIKALGADYLATDADVRRRPPSLSGQRRGHRLPIPYHSAAVCQMRPVGGGRTSE